MCFNFFFLKSAFDMYYYNWKKAMKNYVLMERKQKWFLHFILVVKCHFNL